MNFDLTEDQKLLRDLVERFVTDHCDLSCYRTSRADPKGYAAENWTSLAELGLLALPFPEEVGGLGGGPVELITVMEALGRGPVAEPLLEEVLIGGAMIAAAGTTAQKATWLPAIMTGERHVALAHAEPQGRYELAHVETWLRPQGGIEGSKSFVLSGAAADAFIVSVREDGAVGVPQGIAFYLVPAEAPGLERRTYRLVDGSVACELDFYGVHKGERLAGGFDALQSVVRTARLAACAEMVGLMAMLLDTTLDYVRTRRQFGVPIGSFQAIQHRMADLYVALELSRSHLYRAALAADSEADRSAAAAKAFISTAAVQLGEECIQFHGGIGISDELVIGHGHKRLLLLSTLFGDADHDLMEYHRMVSLKAPPLHCRQNS